MEADDDQTEVTKKCFTCKERLMDNLNIVYNASTSTVIFWNKYQIFVYENLDFENTARVFVPDFQVSQLTVSNNYLVCLDCSGNVHTTSLKFKHSTQKRFKSSFQPREQGIITFIYHSQDNTLSIKCINDSYFLCLHKINAEFQLIKSIELKYDIEQWPLIQPMRGKCLLTSHAVNEEDFDYIKQIFNMKENVWKDYSIVVITFDKFTVYGCLISPKMTEEEITLTKLHSCPSEICDIKLTSTDSLNCLIGITSGTLIRLPLKSILKTPDIIHLNIAIYRFITLKDTVIYTDGISMWKTEHTFSHENIKFSQFYIRHVKDFVRFGDQIICTTFTNLIYLLSIDDDMSYLKPVSTDQYCAAEKMLNNTEYLYNIMEELEKSNDLAERVHEEASYITAMSLSNRQDVMDNVIHHRVVVYETYEDAIKENTELMLTDDITEYFVSDTFYILVKITITEMQHMFNDVLMNLTGELKAHITVLSESKLIKTTSIKIVEPLKNINALISLSIKKIPNTSQINIHIKIVSSVPGAFDVKQSVWTTLYRKRIILNSEHFIKTNLISNPDVCSTQSEENIEDLIFKAACNQHGELFQFTDISKCKPSSSDWSFYVKLPDDYEEILKNEEYYKEYFNKKKTDYLLQQCSAEEFLKGKSDICFEIVNGKVKLGILKDEFCGPVLKISSDNAKIAFKIRYFFSNLIYRDFKNFRPGQEFVVCSLYTTIENLQKAIQASIDNGLNTEEFLQLAQQFERNVIGAIAI